MNWDRLFKQFDTDITTGKYR